MTPASVRDRRVLPAAIAAGGVLAFIAHPKVPPQSRHMFYFDELVVVVLLALASRGAFERPSKAAAA